jgi:hypothetical protein
VRCGMISVHFVQLELGVVLLNAGDCDPVQIF